VEFHQSNNPSFAVHDVPHLSIWLSSAGLRSIAWIQTEAFVDAELIVPEGTLF
jgi:hypothetical protein